MASLTNPTDHPINSPGNQKTIQSMKDGNAEAIEKLLWAAAQSNSLANLKLFHTMAKNVNDQQ